MANKTIIPKAFFFLIAQCFFLKSIAQNKDTIFFVNKSILIGELRSIKLGRIEFDGDGIGIVNIKYNKIGTIQSNKQYYRIETIHKEVIPGFINRSPNKGMIIAKTALSEKEISIGDISSMFKYGSKWSSRINGNLGAGYSYTKSSKIGRFNFDGSMVYHNAKTEIELGSNTIVTSDSTTVVIERANLNLRYNYYFSDVWFAVALLNYQRNIELGLDKRWQQGLALGYKFILTKHSQGVVLGGFTINQEKAITNQTTNNSEIVAQAKYNFYSFNSPNISFSTTQTLYKSTSQKNRFRYDGDISINWELITDFSLNLTYYNNYDSKSPATGGARSDYGFVASLSYKF